MNKLTIQSFIMASIISLVGCGSGGKSDKGDYVYIGSGQAPKVEYPEYQLGEITGNNVEEIISEIHQFNDLWIYSLYSELENITLKSDVVITVANFPNGTYDKSEICKGLGKFIIEFFHLESLQDESGFRVYGPGDYLDINMEFCGLGTGYYMSGRHKRTVIAGYYDDSKFLRIPSKLEHLYQHKVTSHSTFNLTDFDLYYDFKHGKITFELEDLKHINVEAKSFSEKSGNYRYSSSYKVDSFNLSLAEVDGLYLYYKEYELTSVDGFSFSNTALKEKYNLSYIVPIHYATYNSSFSAGKILVNGRSSKLELMYQDTFISYRLDQNGDNDFELSGIISYNDI